MKKTLVFGFAAIMMIVASSVCFAGSTNSTSNAGGDHEGKPCHFVSNTGSHCRCRSCYGNNWGNYYCIHCGHSVKCHY